MADPTAFAPVANTVVVILTMVAFRALAGAGGSLDLSLSHRLVLGLGTTAGVVARAAVPLIALTEHDGGTVPLHRRDCPAAPLHLEAQVCLVVLEAGVQVLDSKYGKHATQNGRRLLQDIDGRL